MIWLSVMALGASVMLVKFGALSVWVGILSAGLWTALAVIAGLMGLLLWKRLGNN